MNILLCSLLFCGFLCGSLAFFDSVAVNSKKTTSNAANSACHTFANLVKRHPLKPPRKEEVGFQLRTTCKRANYLVPDAVKLKDDPNFDANKKTVVFVAGWITPIDKDYIEELARSYHCRGGYNFIVANTGGYIINEYINSAYHTGKLGELLAEGLKNTGLPAENIYLVGHSLGAQIVGSMGRHYYKLTENKLPRITGLDPARPCFKKPAAFPRLEKSDAVHVDIIHSNPYDLGMEESIGHVDYYVNGLDVIKPGCSSISVRCSHELAIQYYLETVYPEHEKSYEASKCQTEEISASKCTGDKSLMGYLSPPDAEGVYYLSVKAKSPYGPNATGDASFRQAACGRCNA